MSALDSVKERIEQRPKQAVIASAIVGVLVGGILGLGVGYKVEHDRKSTNKSNKTTNPTTPTTKKSGTATAKITRAEGKVTATASGSITLQTVKGATDKLVVSGDTVFDRAATATSSDVTAGSHVLVRAPGAEVLILRSGTTEGREVTSISATELVVKAANGLPAGKIKISSRTIYEKVSAATAADVKTGDRIIALGASGTPAALKVGAVIILSAASKFAS